MANQLSALQQRKFTRFFNLLDIGVKGYLCEEDIFEISLRTGRKTATANVEQKTAYLVQFADKLWRMITKYGISGDPDKVYLLDWLLYHQVVIGNKKLREEMISTLYLGIFEMFKNQNTGNLTENGFVEWIVALGVEADLASWTFKKLDAKNNGYLSKEDFISRVWEFYDGTDINLPGNYLMGPF